MIAAQHECLFPIEFHFKLQSLAIIPSLTSILNLKFFFTENICFITVFVRNLWKVVFMENYVELHTSFSVNILMHPNVTELLHCM